MRNARSGWSGIRTAVWVSVAVWACILGLTGCVEEQASAPAKGEAQGAAVGEAIESDDWTLTLVGSPHKAETVGTGTNCGPSGFSAGCLTAAEGVFLIAPVELTSRASELKMISSSVFLAEDDQGNEFSPVGPLIHIEYLWESDEDRWDQMANQIPGNMLDSGDSIEGPLIFDVPVDASALALTLEGIEETIDLGF